jgi:DNA-binding CsgD family transcriptional regulator
MKKVASLTAFLSLFFVMLTSAVLFIIPHGRVAYWANWELWSLSKDQWTAIHINAGILFLIAVVVHTCFNWKNIVLYMKNKRRHLQVFTRDFNIALVLTLLFVTGAQFGMPPFSTIIAVNEHIKDAAARKYGEPPYGHAELSSVRVFAKHMDIDLASALQKLETADYRIASASKSLKEIAVANHVSPQEVYLAMIEPADSTGKSEKMPLKPVKGVGKLTLEELLTRYSLNTDAVTKTLKEKNIRWQSGMTLKQIAESNGLSPIDVYDNIREIADRNAGS